MGSFLQALWHVFAALLIIVWPPLGVWSYRRFLQRVDTDPRVRGRYYLSTIWQQWAYISILAVLLLKTPDPFSSIGIRLPGGQVAELGWALIVGVAFGFVLTVLLTRGSDYRNRAHEKLKELAPFLPVTERERWLWVGVALTAAVCEEVLFRGFLTLYIGHYLPSLYPALIAVLAGIAFGLAHTYQGFKGVLATGVMGIFLGLVYWLTKSLIPGIVFHAFVNLRVLLVWRGTVETEATVS